MSLICRECGSEIPDEDVDRGFAFFDGKDAFCYKCVKRYFLKIDMLRREVDFKEKLRSLEEIAVQKQKEKKRLRKRFFYLMILIIIFSLFFLLFFLHLS